MNDTIAAISTAPGIGAISIVRLSGDDSIAIADKLFRGISLANVNSHTIHYGYIVEQEEIIDEVLVSVMKAPKTFTTEDIVEINCHGGLPTTKKVLELVLQHGARLAEPGEFTKRAYLNNRIDLIEAEGIMELIGAKTEKARKVAMNHVDKNLSNLIHELRNDMLKIIANIEVNIDYPEYEDILVVTNDLIAKNIKNIKSRVLTLLRESENSKIIQEGIKTVIIGKPNVGKSSLLNALLGLEKAIVTDIPGTTRDLVEGSITIDGILLNIIDTAGIRQTDDKIEKIGISKSLSIVEEAELVLLVLNNNEKIREDDLEIISKLKNKKIILFVNKMDLETKIDRTLIKNYDVINGSIRENMGIKELKQKIRELFHFGQIEESNYLFLSNVRQISLLKEVTKEIEELEYGLNLNFSVDILEINLKRIWELLGDILGATPSNELVDQLFKQFCLGK